MLLDLDCISYAESKTQRWRIAWNWLSPIPGTLNTQQYGPNQSGISLYVGIADNAPRSASLIVAIEAAAAARLDDSRRLGVDCTGQSKSVGICRDLRHLEAILIRPKLSRAAGPAPRFVPVEQMAGGGGRRGGVRRGGKRVQVSIWLAKGRARVWKTKGGRCRFCTVDD